MKKGESVLRLASLSAVVYKISIFPFFFFYFTGSIIEIKKRKGGETVVHELQRVIARCECEFQYINLDDELDPVAKEYTPKTPTVIFSLL